MAITGFDPSIVNAAINSVNNAYNDLIRALGNDMQTQFVDEMASKWACPNAQTFFNGSFKPAIDGLISDSNRTFESVVSTINSAGQAWAAETGASYGGQAFSGVSKTIDTSSIQENIGGVRGIDLESTGGVVGRLSSIAASADSALSSAQSAVSNSGFVGGAQQANLISSLGTIKTKISNATNELTSGVKTAIDQTVD